MVCGLISFPNQDAPCILVLTKGTKSWPFGTFVLCTVMIFLPEQHQWSSECRYLRRQGSALCRVAKKHQKRTFLPLFRCCLFCLRQWEGEKKKIRSKIKLCQGCRKGKVQGTRSQPGPSSSFTRVGIPAGHRASCRPPGARRAQGGKGHGDTACGLCTGCGDTLYRL